MIRYRDASRDIDKNCKIEQVIVICLKVYRMITLPEYLKENPRNQVSTPSLSSWGYKGYAEVWLEGSTSLVYKAELEEEAFG